MSPSRPSSSPSTTSSQTNASEDTAIYEPWQRWQSHEVGLISVGLLIGLGLVIRAGLTHPTTLEVWSAALLYGGVIQGLRRLHMRQSAQPRGSVGWLLSWLRPKRLVQLRLLLAYGFTLWCFGAFARIIPAWGREPMDASLLAVDRWLFGETPSALWTGTPALTVWLSGAYLSYLLYLHAALAHYAYVGGHRVRWIWRYVFWTYCIGFVGYLCIPAVGPLRAYPDLYKATLPGMSHWLSQLNHGIVSRGSGVYDVFPSLHVLITCVILHVDWRHCRWRFWIALPLSLPLFASTLYLHYHYAIDLVAGFGLFVLLAWWFQRDQRSDI